MVIYTDEARKGASSPDVLALEVASAVSETNEIFRRSKVVPRIYLVGLQEVAYEESSDFNKMLADLADRDGPLKKVHQARNQAAADLVSMIVENDSLGGLAYQMRKLTLAFENQAFSLVSRKSMNASLSFAHELGHNMGCDHDRPHKQGGAIFDHAYGWSFKANAKTFRTVMSVGVGRIPHFSNPHVNFRGVPTGVAIGQANSAFNADVINKTAPTVANFRNR